MPEDDDQHPEGPRKAIKPGLLWWFKQILLTGIAIFFVFFGISLLVGAYQLNDPFSFIMTFFGASLMTLISVVMVMGFVVQMMRMRQAGCSQNDEETSP